MKYYLVPIVTALLLGCSLPPKPYEAREVRNRPFVNPTEYAVGTLVETGMDSFNRGRYEDARDSLLQAQYLAPRVEAIEANLALTYIKTGEFEAATALYESLVDAHPRKGEYRFGLASALRGLGRIEEALHHFKEAQKDMPLSQEDEKVRIGLNRSFSQVYFRLGLEPEAVCAAQETHSESKAHDDLVGYIDLLGQTAQYERLEKELKALYPNEVPDTEGMLLHVLALARLAQGEEEEFRTLEEKAKNSFPKNEALINEIEFIDELLTKTKEEVQGDEELMKSRFIESKHLSWPPAIIEKLL